MLFRSATQLNKSTEKEFNELLVKISEGDIPSVKQLIKQTPGILNQRDQDGDTCIDYAIGNKQPELAEWMLGFNPDLTTQNKDGRIALELALIKEQSELAKRMIEKNPALLNIKNDNGVTVLMQAIYHNMFEIVEYMLAFNPDLTIQTKSGETACALALFKKNNTSD